MDVFTLRRHAERFDGRWADLDYYRQEFEVLAREHAAARGREVGNDGEELAEIFTQLLHGSIWTMFVSLADVELRNLARYSGELFDPPVHLRQLSGSWSDRARVYFT